MSFVNEKERGLTLLEVLVIVVVIAVFAAMLIPAPTMNKARALRVQCVNNLKQIGLADRIWEGTNGDHYPNEISETNSGVMEFMNGSNAFRYFQVMSNELLTPQLLGCPADTKRVRASTFSLKPLPGEIPFTSNSNVSYFVGLDANGSDPQTVLMGDRNITNGTPLKNGILELTPNRPTGWTDEIHRKVGNILLADGSVQQESITGLNAALTNTPAFTNRLLMPVLGP